MAVGVVMAVARRPLLSHVSVALHASSMGQDPRRALRRMLRS